MTLKTIEVQGYECERCGWKWVPNGKYKSGDERPRRCPNPECRSAYWDIPRKDVKQ